jgi:hypothetical protein
MTTMMTDIWHTHTHTPKAVWTCRCDYAMLLRDTHKQRSYSK